MSSAKHQQTLQADFFARDVATVARELIGTTFLVDGVGGMIVEAEAYDVNRRAIGTPDRRRTGTPLAMMCGRGVIADSRDACGAGRA